jgi:hypothetical protein
VPEIPVAENRDSLPSENDIRFSGQPRNILAISKSSRPEKFSQEQFMGRIYCSIPLLRTSAG